MKGTHWRMLMAALLAIAMFALAACGDDENEAADTGSTTPAEATETAAATPEKFEAGTTLGDIQEKGEITIGVKFDVPPFGFKNTGSGDVEGFDIDMGQ